MNTGRGMHGWMAVVALLLTLASYRTAAAQNVVGGWAPDVEHSALPAPLGDHREIPSQAMSIRLDGGSLLVDVTTTGILSLNSLGLANEPLAVFFLPPMPGTRPSRASPPVVQHLRYQLEGADPLPWGDAIGQTGTRVVHAAADLAGLEITETWGHGRVRLAKGTSYRTSPGGETLTIDTAQGDDQMVRVFLRRRWAAR